MTTHLKRSVRVITHPIFLIGIAIIIAAIAITYAHRAVQVAPSGVYSIATVGSTTEEVTVNGSVQSAQSTTLSFQVPGQIASINTAVGQHVYAGQTLLTLNNASQQAALAQAQAALEVQQAQLASLQAGTVPQQLAIDETNVTQTNTGLTNAIQSAYLSADDAVHVKSDAIFTNARTPSAKIAFTIPDARLVATVESERVAIEPLFSKWQTAINSNSDVLTNASLTSANLSQIGTFLDNLATALSETPPGNAVSSSMLSGYEVSVNAARSEVSGAIAALTAATTAYKNATGALTLAQSGATANQIAAQQAAVDAAQAGVTSAKVLLSETVLTAPVSGTITTQNANPGEAVSPGVPLISMDADGAFEATAQVSQNDIAKIVLGQPVTVTSDSYPGVTFTATVTRIDPSATVTNGVASYGVTVTFTKNSPQLSSGLAVNLSILTETKSDVLLVPTSALLQTSSGTFVFVESPAGPIKTAVTTGIEGANGETEIVSGITAGQQVLTFGSSAQD